MTTYNDLNASERQAVNDLIYNSMMSRQSLIKQMMDGSARDLDSECHYPKTSDLGADQYRDMYDREGVGTRVVEIYPKECWKVQPSVYEDEDPEVATPFEASWQELNRQLRSNSRYRSEEGSPAWELLRRADILSGIGRYGIILLGLDDGLDPTLPATQRKGQKLLYARTFDESMAEITARETDPTNPRYGLPNSYLVKMDDPRDVGGWGSVQGTLVVHWSRIVHLADNLASSEIFGVSRMRPVWNRLLDLRKLYGGSAEMFWKGAFPGMSIETHPQLGGDVEVDVAAIREQMEQYMNGLQRYLSSSGMTVRPMSPTVADPSSHIDRQLDAICIAVACPKRVFMGSERGQLASGQDDETWNSRLEDRQQVYITPRVIVPFVDRLIQLGVLTEPGPDGYTVYWPSLTEATESEKAAVAVQRTDAMSKYVGGGVDMLVDPLNYLTRIIGLDEDVAMEILEAVLQHVSDGGMPKVEGEEEEETPEETEEEGQFVETEEEEEDADAEQE